MRSTNHPVSHLSPRLKAVAELVPACRRLLDIGTDHAWLPIELVRHGCCQTALAIDIRPGPLAAADRHIRAAGLTGRIQTCQADGLNGIDLDEGDAVVLAGMGGYEMMDILGPTPRHCRTLVLQPMKSLPELRLWLYRNGYVIQTERLAVEKNHAYVIISCRYTGSRRTLSDLEALVGPCLLLEPPQPGLHLYLDKLLQRLHKQSLGEPALQPVIELIRQLQDGLPEETSPRKEASAMNDNTAQPAAGVRLPEIAAPVEASGSAAPAIQAETATVSLVLRTLDELAPPGLAESWDKIGLQVGDPDWPVRQVLLALDITDQSIKDAETLGCQLIICHHPPIFNPLASLRTDIPEQQQLFRLISRRISVIAAHTNLDAAPGGVADSLAEILGLGGPECRPVAAYGRSGRLAEPELLSRLLARIRQTLGSSGCRINTDQDRLITSLAVFPGSLAEEFIPDLVAAGVEAVVCGEIKHHLGLMLAARGMAAIDAGHDVTERVVLAPLAASLRDRLPQISFAVSNGMDYNKMAF